MTSASHILRLTIFLALGACDKDPIRTVPDPCGIPEALFDVQGGKSGLVRCADGAINRVAPGKRAHGVCEATEAFYTCAQDVDCDQDDGERCLIADTPAPARSKAASKMMIAPTTKRV